MSSGRLDRFQRWALATTTATYALIAIGGLVRASGAGLGCPDWPKCFDRWIPPFDARDVPAHIDPALFNVAKAWTEYLNRAAGVAVGVLIFMTLFLAFRHHRRSPRIFFPTLGAFVLVGFEGWLGGRVVASKLSPFVLTVHLTFALIIVSLLLYATVCAFFEGGRPIAGLPRSRILIGRATAVVTTIALFQVGLGAFVRGELQLAAAKDPLAHRGEWLAGVGVIDDVHRSAAFLVGLLVVTLAAFIHRTDADRWLHRGAISSVVLVLLQALVGAGLASLDLPPALQVAHLWLGALLLGALTVVVLLAYRLDSRTVRTS